MYLAKARQRAFENRVAISDQRDPLEEKRAKKLANKRQTSIPTFRRAAERTYEALKPTWSSGKHVKDWMQSMERHAFPVLAELRVDEIDGNDVLRVLTPIWDSRHDTATKVRQRIRAVLRWSQAHGYIENNAAGEGIDGALPAMRRVQGHFRALP